MSNVVPNKSKMEISQNFVAFSEYMNFTLELKTQVNSALEHINVTKDTLETIAWKRDLRVSQMTFVGIHNRRAPGYIKHVKKYKKSKPFKKSCKYHNAVFLRAY